MAKTYTVHYSAKYAAAGSSASATALYGQANPEGIYPAGIYQNKTRAVVCLFSGLSGITASRVTGITLHLQRLAGGSNITYSVNLTHSVLSESLGISGTSFTLRRGQPIFTDNDEQWQWVGHDTDVGGEYQTISIPAGLFAQLRDYGWAITYRTSSHARSIFVGDVSLSVTTSDTDCSLAYNANGGSGAPGKQTGTGVGSHTFTISGTKPTRAGHTFLGWSLSSTATSASYQPGGSITLTASATLYAVWRINTYTVSYNANGGSGAPASQTKTYGAPLTLSAAKPTRAGHTFLGWNTKADGSGAGYAAGGSYTANAAATLYAQWQANAYAVTFDAQGGSVTPAGKSVTYGQPYGALPVPERPGYRFDGWFTAAAGGTQVTAETVVAVTAAQTLYARWTVQSIVRVMGEDGALHAGVVYVMGADGALHVGIVHAKGTDGALHVNG